MNFAAFLLVTWEHTSILDKVTDTMKRVDSHIQLQGKTLLRAIQVLLSFLGNSDKMMKLCHQVNLKTSDVTFFAKTFHVATTIYWLNRCKDSPGQKFVVVFCSTQQKHYAARRFFSVVPILKFSPCGKR